MVKLTSHPAHPELLASFQTEGFAIARGLFAQSEVDELNAHFAEIHREPPREHYDPAAPEAVDSDLLKTHPRVMNPHRWDELSLHWLTDPRVASLLRDLIGEEAIGAQTMYYYKPPGSPGQTLHQDNFYLQVMPGTCVAAWTALDVVDKRNGGLMVVPKTHEEEINCSRLGKTGSYEGGTSIPVPAGLKARAVEMAPGDTLFFNGELIHGSGPNRTEDRWRRTMIGHYAPASCQTISRFYHPLVSMDQKHVPKGVTTNGGPCGEDTFEGAAH
jgi:ectoine hydroxylase-related dioxygenase (phytanoyl-CoA dioxygenase family)